MTKLLLDNLHKVDQIYEQAVQNFNYAEPEYLEVAIQELEAAIQLKDAFYKKTRIKA